MGELIQPVSCLMAWLTCDRHVRMGPVVVFNFQTRKLRLREVTVTRLLNGRDSQRPHFVSFRPGYGEPL